MGFMSIIVMAAVIGMAGRIAQKAGFSAWWGVIQIVPLFGVIMIWVLAFVAWPAAGPPRGGKEENFMPGRD